QSLRLSCSCSVFFLMLRRQPSSTLFPYTTLFRSVMFHTCPVKIITTQASSRPMLLCGKIATSAKTNPGKKPSTGMQHRPGTGLRSEEHTSELQSRGHLVCRLLLEKKKKKTKLTVH